MIDAAVVSVFSSDNGGAKLCVAGVLESANFWRILELASNGRDRSSFRIFIKPDLGGFRLDSPLATNPSLVEELIDLLHDRGFSSVVVGTASDSAAVWAANRDIFALFDLMGYNFKTPKDRTYEIEDLSEKLADNVFPATSSLRSDRLALSWLNADFRIVFAKCKTDDANAYALCLDSVIDVLPEQDKDFHYRRARSPGEVVSDVLERTEVNFALIDAMVSSHGTAGRRAPEAIASHTLIASSDITLADYICALKMGVDPHQSEIMQYLLQRYSLPRYILKGDTRTFDGWQNPTPIALGLRRYRRDAEYADRLMAPWLQNLDPALFSLKKPLDSTLNTMLSGFFSGQKHSPTADMVLLAVNALIGAAGHIAESFRVLFDKDSIRRRVVSLGFNPAAYNERIFEDIIDDLDSLESIAEQGPDRSDGLRWRIVDKAVVFSFERTFDIDFDLFTSKVDVAKVIQFMNDYLGGVLIPIEYDQKGRPTRQAERNIYLPQPNYLVLFHGKPIDVSKLECVTYANDRHCLYWKTIDSTNRSAIYDDGKASFVRTPDGSTAVSIIGKQLFELPLFWQVFDLDYIPELKDPLVTDAYRTFFDRTMSNFEALVEGRDIRMGISADSAPQSESDEMSALIERVSQIAAPMLASFLSRGESPAVGELDKDGFVHGSAPDYLARTETPNTSNERFPKLMEFVTGLRLALARDLAMSSKRQ